MMLALAAAFMLAGSGSHAQDLWKEGHALKFGNSKGNGLTSSSANLFEHEVNNGLHFNEKGNGKLCGTPVIGLSQGKGGLIAFSTNRDTALAFKRGGSISGEGRLASNGVGSSGGGLFSEGVGAGKNLSEGVGSSGNDLINHGAGALVSAHIGQSRGVGSAGGGGKIAFGGVNSSGGGLFNGGA